MVDQISAYVMYEWPFSCHEVKNSGYAIPNGVVVQPENFYAATDIVLKVRIGPAAVFSFFCAPRQIWLWKFVLNTKFWISFLNTSFFLSLQVHLVSSSESSSFFSISIWTFKVKYVQVLTTALHRSKMDLNFFHIFWLRH